jgi:hypothetical protein
MKKSIACFILGCVLLALPAQGAELALRNGKAVLLHAGGSKNLPDAEFLLKAAQNSPLRYVPVGEESAEKYGLEEGLYFFTADNKPAGRLITDAADYCEAISFSPDHKAFAMDSGVSALREWEVFAYPSMKPLLESEIDYVVASASSPAMLWHGNDELVYTFMQTDTQRACNYDPCGEVSVFRMNIKTGQEKPVQQASALCDYFLLGIDKDVVTLGKRCLKTVKAWEKYPENVPLQPMNIPLR